MNCRPFLSLLLCLCLWMGCIGSQPSPEELAGEAAKDYYESLVAGDYEAFLNGRVEADSISADYRQQLMQAYKQFVREQVKAHGGIAEVSLSTAKSDTLQHLMQVFLVFTFRDSVKEEIVVPMIEHNGQWRMR